MKLAFFNEQTFSLRNSMPANNDADGLYIELEIYKKLLNFSQAGDNFYFTFNNNNLVFEMLSPQVESLLGFSPSTFTMPLFISTIHPEDLPWFFAFETMAADFLSKLPITKLTKYKTRFDYRVKGKNGRFVRLLQQSVVIEHDEKGHVGRTLGLVTDITHLKAEGKPMLSYIGMDGEPSYLDVKAKNNAIENTTTLTNREKEILKLLMEGKLSKEIGDILYISKQTVDTHRKNMLRKNSINNTGELISKAIRQGLV